MNAVLGLLIPERRVITLDTLTFSSEVETIATGALEEGVVEAESFRAAFALAS